MIKMISLTFFSTFIVVEVRMLKSETWNFIESLTCPTVRHSENHLEN